MPYDVGNHSMKTIARPNGLFDAIANKLTAEDDRDFWRIALTVLADEFLQKYGCESKTRNWIVLVGACSHWIRPHQTRWTAAGGFAWPEGYKNFSPELDWSAIFCFQNQKWEPVEKFSRKRQIVFCVAIPTRSARHRQAAVHTKWLTSQTPVLYGFRKLDGHWKCVAASDERLRGRVSAVSDSHE